VLESYNTRELLKRTREELATALYQHDAAVRVIARLTRERDEARDALSKLTIAPTAAGASAGASADDAMAVDNITLSQPLQDHVDDTHQQFVNHRNKWVIITMDAILTSISPRLSKGRKKRPVPPEWATPDDIAALQLVASTELTVTQPETLAVQAQHAAIGGLDGKLDIYSLEANKVERTLDIGEPIKAAIWTENKVFLGTSKGAVKAFVSGEEKHTFGSHAGQVTGLSLHPGGRIAASTGVDKSFVFYDIDELKVVSHIYTDTGMLHPAHSLVLNCPLTHFQL